MHNVEDKYGLVGFSVNPIDGHMIGEGLLEYWEVRLVIRVSNCQEDVENLIVVLCEVGAGEVVAGEFCVMVKNLVDHSETLRGGDCQLRFQLENDLYFCG